MDHSWDVAFVQGILHSIQSNCYGFHWFEKKCMSDVQYRELCLNLNCNGKNPSEDAKSIIEPGNGMNKHQTDAMGAALFNKYKLSAAPLPALRGEGGAGGSAGPVPDRLVRLVDFNLQIHAAKAEIM